MRQTLHAVLALALVLIVPAAAQASPGDVDTSFGRHGVSVLTFANPYAQGSSVAIDASDRIVVAGTTGPSADAANVVAVARLNPDGQLDATFSEDGMATIPLPAKAEVGGIAIDPSGRVLVSATSGGELLALRLLSAGALDSSFSDDGIASLPVAGNATGGDLAPVGDGSIVVGGTGCQGSGGCHFAVGRFTSAGVPDPTFSGDGVVTTDFPSSAALRSVAVAADSSIVAAGSSGADTALSRYLPNGDLDSSFGGGGRAIVSDYTQGAREIAFDDAGRIIELANGGSLLRLNGDGTIDSTWGLSLQFSVPRDGGFGPDGAAGFFVGGRIGGCSRGCSPIDTAVAHVTSGGSVDRAFGSADLGSVTYSIVDLGSQSDGASDVTADHQGRPVIVGFSGARMMVARLTMTPGPPDIDGDGVENAEDRCSYLYGRSSNYPGCPVVRPKLTLRRDKAADLWLGRAVSPDDRCVPKQEVKIFRKRPGHDELLSDADSGGDGSFEADGNLRRGTYYAFVAKAFKPRIGYCKRSRSNEVVIRG